MKNFSSGILATIILVGAFTSKISFGHQENTLQVSGTLAAMPCSNHGGLVIGGDDTHVTPGQSVSCVSIGGEVRINNITVEEGGALTVSAFEHNNAPENELNTQWADTGCTSGDSGSIDCNVCADNVEQQFDNLFGSQAIRSEKYWRLDQDEFYPPSNTRPENVLSPETLKFANHIQGFVKIGVGTYAGTYSAKKGDNGSIFFIDYNDDEERHRLSGLHKAWDHHPSGMSLLGNYVIFGDKHSAHGAVLRIIPTDHATRLSRKKLVVENFNFNAGGGVGMVKLNSGGYLLITTSPGGPSRKDVLGDTVISPRKTDFFYVEGENTVDKGLAEFGSDFDMSTKHLGRWAQTPNEFGEGAKQREYQYSENLSVIPECGSGDIFLIHTSSTKPWRAALQEQESGFWRLSKVVWKSSGPELDILSVHKEDQDFDNCLHRAAATAWVNPNHEIELYCSEYKLRGKETDMHFKIRAVGSEADL